MGFALALAPCLVSAGLVYKCKDASGGVVFSQTSCGTGAQAVGRSGAAAPVAAVVPVDATAVKATLDPSPPPVSEPQAPEWPAYRCSTSDGVVFYRHGLCPRTIAVTRQGQMGRFETAVSGYAPVEAQGVSKEVACAAITAAEAGDRPGSRHDSHYSADDVAKGLDPCR